MRGHGAIGGHLDLVRLDESHEHEEAGFLHESHVSLFLHPHDELDLLHLPQTGESLKPSLKPPTRTSIPSLFLKPERVYANPTIPAPPRTSATVPIINICFQVKFITPSNIIE